MTKLTSLIALFSLFLFSCQKEPSVENPQSGGNNNPNDSKSSYSPLTAGTWWKYKDSVTGSVSTNTVTNVTKKINNISFTAILSTNSANQKDTGWMAAPRPYYYISSKGVSPNTGASYDLMLSILNDTASVGYAWDYNAGHGNGFTAITKTTIKERNISITVAGKKYDNVIHTSQEVSYDIFGSLIKMGTYEYYFAKGIGVVRIESNLSSLGMQFKTVTDLIEYSIK